VGHHPDDVVHELLESARRALGLTRKALAGRLNVSARTYRNWMGNPSKLSADQIERLVKALALSPENRANLYILTGQLPPAPSASELLDTPEMTVYQAILDDSSHPSVIYDYAWDVVRTNAPYRALFGSVRPHATAWPLHNGMKYILFHPDAPQQLGGNPKEFKEGWLMPALANFRAVLQQRPGDPHLQTIERQISRRALTRRAYEALPDWIQRSGDLHVNTSTPRPIWDPRCGELRYVHIVTEAHQGYQPLTLTRATFVFGAQPASAPPPE
jgi:transcriptional regulator with XRE-family HTH domain